MDEAILIGKLWDTDDRRVWVHADSGAIRLDFGTNHGIGGYGLFLTRAGAEDLAECLAIASEQALTQQEENAGAKDNDDA